jgi:hypothetical protein
LILLFGVYTLAGLGGHAGHGGKHAGHGLAPDISGITDAQKGNIMDR